MKSTGYYVEAERIANDGKSFSVCGKNIENPARFSTVPQAIAYLRQKDPYVLFYGVIGASGNWLYRYAKGITLNKVDNYGRIPGKAFPTKNNPETTDKQDIVTIVTYLKEQVSGLKDCVEDINNRVKKSVQIILEDGPKKDVDKMKVLDEVLKCLLKNGYENAIKNSSWKNETVNLLPKSEQSSDPTPEKDEGT